MSQHAGPAIMRQPYRIVKYLYGHGDASSRNGGFSTIEDDQLSLVIERASSFASELPRIHLRIIRRSATIEDIAMEDLAEESLRYIEASQAHNWTTEMLPCFAVVKGEMLALQYLNADREKRRCQIKFAALADREAVTQVLRELQVRIEARDRPATSTDGNVSAQRVGVSAATPRLFNNVSTPALVAANSSNLTSPLGHGAIKRPRTSPVSTVAALAEKTPGGFPLLPQRPPTGSSSLLFSGVRGSSPFWADTSSSTISRLGPSSPAVNESPTFSELLKSHIPPERKFPSQFPRPSSASSKAPSASRGSQGNAASSPRVTRSSGRSRANSGKNVPTLGSLDLRSIPKLDPPAQPYDFHFPPFRSEQQQQPQQQSAAPLRHIRNLRSDVAECGSRSPLSPVSPNVSMGETNNRNAEVLDRHGGFLTGGLPTTTAEDREILRAYATQNDDQRQHALNQFIVENLENEDFLRLVEDVDNCWRRVALGM